MGKIKNKLKQKKRSIFGRIWRFCMWCALLFIAISVLSVIVYRWVNPPITPLMVIRLFDQKLDGRELKMEYDWVDIDSINPAMYQAVIAGEDGYFLFHSGFDWAAVRIAQEYNKTHKDKRGASTISQQTAKNVFLWPDRTWLRKGLEVYFTFLIETFWTKERIMEVYLNIVELGEGIYGVEKASQIYFNKSAKSLSYSEAALLCAGLPNPRKWNPQTKAPQLYSRQSIIIRNMNNIGPQKLEKQPWPANAKR